MKPLRVLSLYPWASLVAIGAKIYETRSWAVRYRGLVAIHAAKSKVCLHLRADEPRFAAALKDEGELPLGAVLAVTRLHDVQLTEIVGGFLRHHGCEDEYAFGDYSEGRFAWALTDPSMKEGVTRVPEPIPFRGFQGLFHAPAELRAAIAAQLPQLDLEGGNA